VAAYFALYRHQTPNTWTETIPTLFSPSTDP
jgi:hypothetical protein